VAQLLERLGRARERIRRWLRPPRVLRPTRAGWLFLLIILGVGFAALNTGNNLLYLVLSLMLSFLVLSGVMSESALRGIEVRRRLPREVFASSENSVQLQIHNTQKRVSSFAVAVEDRLTPAPDGEPRTVQLAKSRDEEREHRRWRKKRRKRKEDEGEPAGRCFALRVAPGESETRRYLLSPAHRGPLHFSGFRVSTRFPFGLFLKYREISANEEVLVYPEVADFAGEPRLRETPTSGDTTIAQPHEGGLVSGLREFGEGDSFRRIHWRSSLRRGSLMVSETEDDRDAEVEVRLHCVKERPDQPEAGRFEQAVSRAASEIVSHLQAGLAVALRTDATYMPPDAGIRQRARLLSFLARVSPDGRAPDPEEAANTAPAQELAS